MRMGIKAYNMGSGRDRRFTLVVAAAAQREHIQPGRGSMLWIRGWAPLDVQTQSVCECEHQCLQMQPRNVPEGEEEGCEWLEGAGSRCWGRGGRTHFQ